MSAVLIAVSDFNKICRLCLQKSDNLLPVLISGNSVVRAMKSCLQIEVRNFKICDSLVLNLPLVKLMYFKSHYFVSFREVTLDTAGKRNCQPNPIPFLYLLL